MSLFQEQAVGLFHKVFGAPKGQREIKPKKPKVEKPNSIVMRPREKGGITFEYVYNAPGGQWLYENSFYYFLVELKGKLQPYEPSEKVRMLPEKLYRAKHWETVKRLLAYKATMLDKINTGLGVALVGILAFIIFVIITQ